MCRLLILFYFVLVNINTGYSQSYKPKNVLEYDLDKDGINETIKLVKHKKADKKDELLHIEVIKTENGKKKTIWKDKSHLYEFYQGMLGNDELDCIGNIFDDGNIILASTAAQSDVSPSWIKFYKWNGKSFEIFNGGYIYGKTLDNKNIENIDSIFTISIKHSNILNEQDSTLVWIYKFINIDSESNLIAEVMNSSGYYGAAKLKKILNGWQVIDWIKPFKAPIHP